MASLLWKHFIQHRSYSDVFIAIKNKKNCLQMQLGIKMGEFDVLICQGRFSNADFDEETKCPKLLPCHETFTHLLSQEIYQRLIHPHSLRQEFWIPQGCVEVKHVISKCIQYTICQLGLLGFIKSKEGETVEKMWVCLLHAWPLEQSC